MVTVLGYSRCSRSKWFYHNCEFNVNTLCPKGITVTTKLSACQHLPHSCKDQPNCLRHKNRFQVSWHKDHTERKHHCFYCWFTDFISVHCSRQSAYGGTRHFIVTLWALIRQYSRDLFDVNTCLWRLHSLIAWVKNRFSVKNTNGSLGSCTLYSSCGCISLSKWITEFKILF